jgi:1-acyl-sn-glycerol-3-phosphate acyltransferase
MPTPLHRSSLDPRPRPNATLRTLLAPAFRTLLDLEVHGVDRVPRCGPCLLVFNHLSNLDPHLILTLLPRRDVTGLVAASYRERAIPRILVEASGGIWIRRDTTDRAALKAALLLLAEGWLVGIAPEGGRSPDGLMRRGKDGAAYLAIRSGAPVLPVGVDGTDRVLPELRRGRRARVRVRFGSPFRPESPFLAISACRQKGREAVTQEIMARIALLVPDERRGAYAGTTVGGAS